eukprot:4741849-Pyramimonas_sp.AAC.1
MNGVNVQSGSPQLLATSRFITTIFLMGSCQQYRPSSTMDGRSSQISPTTGRPSAASTAT